MEIIGRLVVAFLLMIVSAVVGAGCAAVVFLLLKMRRRPRRGALFAFLFPPAAMAYILGCLVLSSVLSGLLSTPDLVFGDIHEKLPNDYVIKALDKMPECGIIEKAENSAKQVAWVDSLQVDGPYVLGRYDYTCFGRTPEEADKNYFSFDTRSGRVANFVSQSDLEGVTKVRVRLIPTAKFRGPKTIWQRLAMWLFLVVTLVPPSATGLWLIYRLAHMLRSTESRSEATDAARLHGGGDRELC